MQVMMLTYALPILMISSTLALDVKGAQSHEKNDSRNVTEGRTFSPDEGTVIDVHQVDGVVRNLLAPIDGYIRNLSSLFGELQPTLYFNIHNKDGENQGLYLLKNGKMRKINDGRDSIVDYPRRGGIDDHIYIATADGIYTYDPHTEEVKKYGNLTDDVIAIEKVSGSDLIYILCADHKIYKVTKQGTEKELVAGVNYAKDFVLDYTENIHYIEADNKPRFLLKDSTEPHQYEDFEFDAVDLIFVRPPYDPSPDEWHQYPVVYAVLLIIDGELAMVTNNSTSFGPRGPKVPNITAYSSEFPFLKFYGAGGKIYLHNLITGGPVKTEDKMEHLKELFNNVLVH